MNIFVTSGGIGFHKFCWRGKYMNSAHMSTIQLQKHSDMCGLSLQEQLQVEMISRSYVEIIQYGTSTCTESSGCCSIRWEGD